MSGCTVENHRKMNFFYNHRKVSTYKHKQKINKAPEKDFYKHKGFPRGNCLKLFLVFFSRRFSLEESRL